MTRTTQFTVGLAAGVSLLGLSATPLVAGHFRELSHLHNWYGVSQFNALLRESESNIVVTNPNHLTQVAAVLLFRKAQFDYRLVPDDAGQLFLDFIDEGPAEQWRACLVVELTPHAAIKLDWPSPPDPPWPDNIYAEVLFVPLDPVRAPGTNNKARRLADGLGGVAGGHDESGSRGWNFVHPGLFTLPSNDVAGASPTQREEACACVCERIDLLGFEPARVNGLFTPFGIVCDGADVVTCGD